MTTFNSNRDPRVAARRRQTLERLQASIASAPPRRPVASGVTLGAYTTAATIPSPVYTRPWVNGALNTANFTFTGAGRWDEPAYPGSGAVRARGPIGLANGALGGPRIRFMTWAPVIEFQVLVTPQGSGYNGLLGYVDGQAINGGNLFSQATAAGDNNTERVYKLTFGSGVDADARPRVIELESTAGTMVLWWVAADAKYPIYPAPQANGLRAAIIGDSMSEQLAGLLGRAIGQTDVIGLSRGSTGWVTAGLYEPIPNRIDSDLLPLNPDVVFELGGRNDSPSDAAAQADYQDLLERNYAKIVGANPAVIIISTPPFTSGNATNSAAIYQRIREAKRAAAREFPDNVIFVDTLASPWVVGTGREGTPANNGNADWAISSDGVHATTAGRELFAVRLAQDVAGALPAALARC